MISIFSELTEKSAKEKDNSLDQVFRLRSRYAEKEGMPQDIIVSVSTRRMKEEILKLSYDNPIDFKGGGDDYSERTPQRSHFTPEKI